MRTSGVKRKFVMKRELPARPDIEQLKRQAKDFEIVQSGETAAIERIRQNNRDGDRGCEAAFERRASCDRPGIWV